MFAPNLKQLHGDHSEPAHQMKTLNRGICQWLLTKCHHKTEIAQARIIYFIFFFPFFSFDRWQKYIVRQATIQEAKQENSNMTRGVIQATKVEDHGHIYENQKPIGKLQQGYHSVGDYCPVLKRHVGRAKSSLTSSEI